MSNSYTMKNFFLTLLFFATVGPVAFSQTLTQGYKNPVIPGFHPDPSICRVGNDFYLVNSSFEYFPGVPLFHSKDLVHWDQIGYCLTRKSQINLTDIRASGGIYAPTIRYHNGVFYMIVTNVNHGGNFIVTAQDPHGEWSDPIPVDQTGIDPSLFFDDDGKVYYTGNTPWDGSKQGIYQFEIDVKTGKKLTETRMIWAGTGGRYPEGPHLYKIMGRYYLMIAEGGTEYGHMETIARSDNPWGPFVSCPYNPILTHRNENAQNNPIQGTGHADLVQAGDGSWWMVFLGFRNSQGQFHHLGRETFLAPVSWTDDGWPVVNENGTVTVDMNVKTLPQVTPVPVPVRDDFTNESLGISWNFLRNPDMSQYSLSEKPGWLKIKGNSYSLDATASPGFTGRRQQDYNCTVTTKMNYSPQQTDEKAGLTVLMNNRFHYDLAITRDSSNVKNLFLQYTLDNLKFTAATIKIKGNILWLRIKADPQYYQFSYSADGSRYYEIGSAPVRFLTSEVAGGFTGVYFGLFASGTENGDSSPAYFDWFDYSAE